MEIKGLIRHHLIELNLKSNSKQDVIFELASMLDNEYAIDDLSGFIHDVKEREALASTGIGYGIAIPHAKSIHVLKPSIVFGRSVEGIDFDAMDLELAHLFFMIAMPENSSNLHLQALAMLSRNLIHETFRQKLIDVKTTEEAFELLMTIDHGA